MGVTVEPKTSCKHHAEAGWEVGVDELIYVAMVSNSSLQKNGLPSHEKEQIHQQCFVVPNVPKLV